MGDICGQTSMTPTVRTTVLKLLLFYPTLLRFLHDNLAVTVADLGGFKVSMETPFEK